ncbi:MAG: septation protein A [Alphaproteobacteria bacterium]|nr:septation protein A [Alphaproteobacteria bacterium]
MTKNSQNSAPKTPHKTPFLCDFGPLICFFATNKFYGLLVATSVLIAATALSLIYMYVRHKRVPFMPLFSGAMVAIFGGITLLLHDEFYIKIKPTVLNLLFAAILLGGVMLKKPMLKYLLGEALQLADEGWMKLSARWGFYFIFLAALNEFIWRNFTTDFWVNFKVFGMMTCTILFTLTQLPLMKRYMVEEGSTLPK